MNKEISEIHGSASMEMMAKAKKMKEQGMDIIGLGGGEPDFDTPKMIKDAAIREIVKGNTHYAVGLGLPKLRKLISHKLMTDNGISMSPEEIIVTPGAKMAIYLAIRSLINYGDEVLVLNPSWVSYSEIVVASGGVPISVPLDYMNNYAIDATLLEQYVTAKTKAIIINSPNNPTGRVLNENEVAEIKKFVLKNHLFIISDEIYEKIIFDGIHTISLAADEELRPYTITINGFSKAYAMTGWRLGYLAADRYIVEVISKLYTHTITGTSPFIQEAACIALECTNEVEQMRKVYELRRNTFVNGLISIPGVCCMLPEGAFYAWARFDSDVLKTKNVCEKILSKAKVIGVPGIAYGNGWESYIRFSFANKDSDLVEAVKRIEMALQGE